MATIAPKIGQTVETKDGRQGLVRYNGNLHIAEGEWLGLELPDASGKNDGSVKGERYFDCQPNYGIFVRKESVTKILRQVPASTAEVYPRANGVATVVSPATGARPRPSTGITPDIARKRQSLMSAASNTTAANRVSLRSPTKSSTKPVSSALSTANTSATSTPRTGTPATTARTSDSSTKSRTSVSSRTAIAPLNSGSRAGNPASRLSISGGPQKPSRLTTTGSRPISNVKKLITPAKSPSSQDQRQPTVHENAQTTDDEPLIVDEDHDPVVPNERGQMEEIANETAFQLTDRITHPAWAPAVTSPQSRMTQNASLSRSDTAKSVESRTAQVREVEQLKAKIRTLENQRQEDLEKLQQHETMQNENARFRNIIQALQNKLKTNQQELGDLRSKYEEARNKNDIIPERSAEQESELELATLDKEMAEERAETVQMELDTLRLKHEELELEVEILREENQELSSVMSPEEKANAGWLQMERERERLREALIMLRDVTQQTEGDLKAEIKDLQRNLEEIESTATKYTETVERLVRAEQTNHHLMEQLEAVESNDEVVEAMEAQREQNVNMIEQLRKHVQELEEHIQVTDELEKFHMEEEKRLHAQLDEAEALLNESQRHNVSQDRIIEDLEYTLTKFRDVVQGLQSDIDELRRSREISEIEANEMSSKSRAMMDLNLRLQNNTAKSQSRMIDAELDKIQSKLGAKHIEVLNMFTLDSFDSEKKSILAYLCFGRLRAKSSLAGKLLNERLRDRAYLSHGEENFKTFELAEQMHWIAALCSRFETFMATCDLHEFSTCATALYELDPVERTVNLWLDALRRDELSIEGPEHLKRMQGVLTDLADKLISFSNETKATQVVVQMQTIENLTESLAGQMSTLTRLVQAKLGGPRDEEEESSVFDKKMDQMVVKSRTIKYLSAKAVQRLCELRNDSLCIGEISWIKFDETERQAQTLVHIFRQIGVAVAEELSKFVPENPLTYAGLVDQMSTKTQEVEMRMSETTEAFVDGDIFSLLTSRMNDLQHNLDSLITESDNINSFTDFESSTAPWITRSRQLKAQTIITPELQDEINQLERRNQELGLRILEREKMIEEMNMRVEVAEKRMKDSRARDDRDRANQEEVEKLRTESEENERTIKHLQLTIDDQVEAALRDRIELEGLRTATNGEVIPLSGAQGMISDETVLTAQLEIDLLQAEINSLQAAVRFLRDENRVLRIPVTDTLLTAASRTWLDASVDVNGYRNQAHDRSYPLRKQHLQGEVKDIYADLINVASSLKPVRLSSRKAPLVSTPVTTQTSQQQQDQTTTSSWRSMSQKTRYTILRQREEWEKWEAWRSDVIERAKVIDSTLRKPRKFSTKPPTGLNKIDSTSRSQLLLPTENGSNLISSPSNLSTTNHPKAISMDIETNNLMSEGTIDMTETIQIVDP